MDDREEKRKALRAKIRGKRDQRSGSALPSVPSLSDPTSALLSLGVDDPSILSNANDIVAAAKSIASSGRLPEDTEEAPPPPLDESDDEAPPPA